MELLLIVVTVSALMAVAVTFVLWVVPFGLFMRRLQRVHRRYYMTLGRPYSKTRIGIPQRDDALPSKTLLARWRGLTLIYSGVSPTFLKDRHCQRLARFSRLGLRFFIPSLAVTVLFIAPIDGFAFSLNQLPEIHFPGSNAQSAAASHLIIYQHPSVPAGPSQPTVRTYTTHSITQKTIDGPPVSQVPVNDSLSSVPQVKIVPSVNASDAPLTRADLNTALASVAPAGQKRASKRDVCQQLVTSEPTAANLGPTGGICSDTNLLTYTAY